jgi:hypothetical protein
VKRLGYDTVLFLAGWYQLPPYSGCNLFQSCTLTNIGVFQLFELEADVKLIMRFSNPGVVGGKSTSQIIALIIRNVNLNQSNSVYVCVCVCVCVCAYV